MTFKTDLVGVVQDGGEPFMCVFMCVLLLCFGCLGLSCFMSEDPLKNKMHLKGFIHIEICKKLKKQNRKDVVSSKALLLDLFGCFGQKRH